MSKLKPEIKKRLVEGIRLGLTNKLAAAYAGISESTFYLWMQQAREGDQEKIELSESLKKMERGRLLLGCSNVGTTSGVMQWKNLSLLIRLNWWTQQRQKDARQLLHMLLSYPMTSSWRR